MIENRGRQFGMLQNAFIDRPPAHVHRMPGDVEMIGDLVVGEIVERAEKHVLLNARQAQARAGG